MLRPLTVCLVSREYPPETGWGGIGNYTYYLAHGLSRLGCQVHVISQGLDEEKYYLDEKVHVHRITHKIFLPLKSIFREFALRLEYSKAVSNKVCALIDKFGIQIVEVPNFSAEGFVFSLLKKRPLITRLHTHFTEIIKFSHWPQTLDRRLSCQLEETTILRSDLVTCSTKVHADIVFTELGIAQDNIEIIPLGIPLPKTEDKTINNKNPIILFVGRLERRKGVHILSRAIPHVLEKYPTAVFNIIGRDTFITNESISFAGSQNQSFKNELLNQIPENYRNNVNFLGYVKNEKLASYYAECDIFVAPSLYESFGLIYIEAMSYAKPVIGCGVGGVTEIIEDNVSGALVPPEDHLALAGKILELLDNYSLRIELGKNGCQKVKDNFTDLKMAERTLSAYLRILGK